jgi:hypothetical protein
MDPECSAMNMTRREALTVGVGAALALAGAAGLTSIASSAVTAEGTYRGVRYRVLAGDVLELDGQAVDSMAFGQVGGRYVSHLLCYSDTRDRVTLARRLIDGQHDRLFQL